MSTLNVSNITDGTTTVGTEYVVNGSAKAWCAKIDMFSTPSVADSLNVSSLTDVASGAVFPNWTNSFNSTAYSHHGSDGYYGMMNADPNGQTVSQGRCYCYSNSFSLTDTIVSTSAFGDLA